MIEFASNKSTRVLKSTLAAEAAACVVAYDRAMFAHAVLEAMLAPEKSYTGDWRVHSAIPVILVTDCKSLYDTLTTTGSIPSERSTMLDLLSIRESIESLNVQIRWVNTNRQLADCLTKVMPLPSTMLRFMRTSMYSLTQSSAELPRAAQKARTATTT